MTRRAQPAGRRHHPPRAMRGVALLLAMVILGLVATITAGMVWQQQRAVQVEAAERARAQSGWILRGALDWARLILREDQRANRGGARAFDSLDEPWATPLAEARLSTFLAADKDNNTDGGPEAFISGSIVDAQSFFNLRNLIDGTGKLVPAQVDALQRLADLAGAPSDTAARIAAGLGAAFAPQGDVGAQGAPIRPSTVADLTWLGIDAATVARLAPWVVLLPTISVVNANTAPREVLAAVLEGIDLGSAERLVQVRQRKPFQTLADLQAQLPEAIKADPARVGVGSNWFRVVGRLRLDDRVLSQISLLHRNGDQVTVWRTERQSGAAAAAAGG